MDQGQVKATLWLLNRNLIRKASEISRGDKVPAEPKFSANGKSGKLGRELAGQNQDAGINSPITHCERISSSGASLSHWEGEFPAEAIWVLDLQLATSETFEIHI